MNTVINVHVAFDHEAGVWYVCHSDVHGLRVEASTIEDMIKRVQDALTDLLEDGDGCQEVPLEVIAHHASRVRLHAA